LILLDTHVWIWWLSESSLLSKPAARAIRSARSIGVSAISCWELTLLLKKGRISLDRDPLDWITAGLSDDKVSLLPLSPEIAVTAMNLHLHGDPGDRLIAATALAQNRTLITRDDKLRSASFLRTIW
jgi:PIN domain nuclease of toxin-antitoxin system